MKIKRMTISNFFSFGKDCRVEFGAESPILVRGDTGSSDTSNGAGKSAVFEALHWCLTGRTVRGARAKDVVRLGTSKVQVGVAFEWRGKMIEVVRLWSASSKKLTLTVDGEEIETHDAKQGTDKLFEELGVSPQVLSLIGFFGRDFLVFSRMKPKERAEWVDLIACGDVWVRAERNAASGVREASGALDVIEGRMEQAQEERKGKEERIAQTDERIESRRNELTAERERKEAERAEVTERVRVAQENGLAAAAAKHKQQEEAQARLTAKSEECAKFEAMADVEEPGLPNALGEIDEAEREFLSAESETRELLERSDRLDAEARTERGSLERAVERCRRTLETKACPECGQALPPTYDIEDVAKRLSDAELRLANLAEETGERADKRGELVDLQAQAQAEIAALRDKRAEVQREYERDVRKHRERMEEVNGMQRELADLRVEAERLNQPDPQAARWEAEVEEGRRRLDALASELAGLDDDSELAGLRGRQQELRESVAEIAASEEVLREKAASHRAERDLCAYWKVGFKDIRFSRYNEIIGILADALNALCQQQALDFDAVEIDAWKELASGDTVPEINLRLVRGGRKLALDNLSEGEAQRVDIACFIALGMIIEAQLGFDAGFRVLDEPLSGLDHDGKQRVFGLLNDLAADKQVFVVDHDATFQSLFRAVLTVRKEDGVSGFGQ